MPVPFDQRPHDEHHTRDGNDEDRATDYGLLGLKSRGRGELVRYMKESEGHYVWATTVIPFNIAIG